MTAQTRAIAKVNNVKILLIENGEKFVPIRPICEALGIDVERQRKKIKEDLILSSTAALRPAVGSDGKKREMTCLPYMYVFGWLFTINPKNVKDESRESVMYYKLECYRALYNHFTEQSRFLEDKQGQLEAKLEELDKIRHDFNVAKDLLSKARKELNTVKEMTFAEWQATKQMEMEFPEIQEN